MRCRITFETDAANDYFSRNVDPGEFALFIISENSRSPMVNYNLLLQNGLANLSMRLPENCNVGDKLCFVAIVTDPTLIRPFENNFEVIVKPVVEQKPSGGRPPSFPKAPGKEEGVEREIPSGIQLPNIIEIYEGEWETREFTKTTALRIKNAGDVAGNGNGGSGGDIYDFFVNMDNLYLKTELKLAGEDARITKLRFKYGLVLLGLALLQQEMQRAKETISDEEEKANNDEVKGADIEKKVEDFSRAVAPVLIPLIESLGDLEVDESYTMDASGEET